MTVDSLATPLRPRSARGLLGSKSRQVLDGLYWETKTVSALADELAFSRATTWALIKHLMESGYVERTCRGHYQTSAAGRSALNPVLSPTVQAVRSAQRVCRPAPSYKWSRQQVLWLERHYPVLGYRRSAVLLGRDRATVFAKAKRLGLRWGHDIEGYTTLTELAQTTGLAYVALWTRARRAGVLTSTATSPVRRLVPDAWAEQIMSETALPAPNEIRLDVWRTELGISKTHAQRLTRGLTVSRRAQGDKVRPYLPADAVTRLTTEWLARPDRPQLGRPAVYAAISRAGAAGLTEQEIRAVLKAGQGMVRVHVRALYLEGQLQRCRLGDHLDPFVYRLIAYRDEPVPSNHKQKAAL